MSEIDRMLDQLRRAYDGDAWHGPSLRGVLDDVDWRQATQRPFDNGHTIAELVRHITAWMREITRRLWIGIAQDPEDGDWPDGSIASEEEWAATLDALAAAHEEVLKAMARLTDADLDERIGDARDRPLGSGVSRYVTLHGLVQHHAYHAGQIALLRKAKAAR